MRNPRSIVNARALAVAVGALTIPFAFAAHASEKGAKTERAVASPTFDRDIAPIMFKHCANCHRSGEATPFALLTYADVKSHAKVVADVTRTGQMPPWRAGDADCPLKNDIRLSEAQKTTIQNWLSNGTPEGSVSDLPPTPTFVEGWQLGKPDLIVRMPKPYKIRAEGADIYRCFVIPLHLTEDKWVAAIEYHPTARKEVHHTLFFYDATGSAAAQDGQDGEVGIHGAMPRIQTGAGGHEHGFFGGGQGGGGGLFGGGGRGRFGGGDDDFGNEFQSGLGGDGGSVTNPGKAPFASLGGWALGAITNFLPDGLAYHVPKNADLILATHFHMSGKEDLEQSEVGLYFAKQPPTKQFTSIQLPPGFGIMAGLNVPAGDKDWELKDSMTLPVDVKAFWVTGHAHFIASKMILTATLPDGTKKTVFIIPKWDFAWQGQYQFKEFETLPKGTRLDVSIHYDNSAENPYNPFSPPQRIRWGTQTTAEMGSVTILAVAANEDDMPALRKAYKDHVLEQFENRLHIHLDKLQNAQ